MSARMPSPSRRSRRTVDNLEHPDEEAVAADDTDGDDWPDTECEDEEGQQFPSPRSCWLRQFEGRCFAALLGHDLFIMYRGPARGRS